MSEKMVKSKVAPITDRVKCIHCNGDIWFCDSCKEYFEVEEVVYCDFSNHYCNDCKEHNEYEYR